MSQFSCQELRAFISFFIVFLISLLLIRIHFSSKLFSKFLQDVVGLKSSLKYVKHTFKPSHQKRGPIIFHYTLVFLDISNFPIDVGRISMLDPSF